MRRRRTCRALATHLRYTARGPQIYRGRARKTVTRRPYVRALGPRVSRLRMPRAAALTYGARPTPQRREDARPCTAAYIFFGVIYCARACGGRRARLYAAASFPAAKSLRAPAALAREIDGRRQDAAEFPRQGRRAFKGPLGFAICALFFLAGRR